MAAGPERTGKNLEYDLGGVLAKAYLRGETLMVLVLVSPIEMVPLGNQEFKFKVLEGYSVRFDLGPDGKTSAVTFIQPERKFPGGEESSGERG
ncbi:MAG: hypothetical protein IPN20_04915 [Haliscomenobacter sp.]|nr:hypothetical protein [Haliscomenobacter sp.]